MVYFGSECWWYHDRCNWDLDRTNLGTQWTKRENTDAKTRKVFWLRSCIVLSRRYWPDWILPVQRWCVLKLSLVPHHSTSQSQPPKFWVPHPSQHFAEGGNVNMLTLPCQRAKAALPASRAVPLHYLGIATTDASPSKKPCPTPTSPYLLRHQRHTLGVVVALNQLH